MSSCEFYKTMKHFTPLLSLFLCLDDSARFLKKVSDKNWNDQADLSEE